MSKKVFHDVTLTCVFQNANSDFANLGTSNSSSGSGAETEYSEAPPVVNGMLSRGADGGVLFQETVAKKREVRNNRLYEGTLANLVLRKDGRYHPFVKGYKPGGKISKQDYAFRVYCEINEALKDVD